MCPCVKTLLNVIQLYWYLKLKNQAIFGKVVWFNTYDDRGKFPYCTNVEKELYKDIKIYVYASRILVFCVVLTPFWCQIVISLNTTWDEKSSEKRQWARNRARNFDRNFFCLPFSTALRNHTRLRSSHHCSRAHTKKRIWEQKSRQIVSFLG